jgi:hypothetical protein
VRINPQGPATRPRPGPNHPLNTGIAIFEATGQKEASLIVAGIAGSSFAGNGSNGSSLGVALATAVAMFCYLAAIFTLRRSQPLPRCPAVAFMVDE